MIATGPIEFNPIARAFELAATAFRVRFGAASFWAAAAERGRREGTATAAETFQQLLARSSARFAEKLAEAPSVDLLGDGFDLLEATRIWRDAQRQAQAEGRAVIEELRARIGAGDTRQGHES